VLDVLLRDHRHGESAQAFFQRTLGTTGQQPDEVITDHHQPYVKAVAANCPAAKHTRTGLHRARGETTKPTERSHVPTRDRLRSSGGFKTLTTGQRFFEGFEVLQALHRGHVHLRDLVPDHNPADAMAPHVLARAAVLAVNALGARLRRYR
jgi:transposase-like protein